MDSTFDEIRRCLRCQELGSPDGTTSLSDRSTIYRFVCQNPNCRWFQSAPWIRQRNPDGTWLVAQPHKKFFPDLPYKTEEVQRSIDASIARQTNQ